MCAINVVPEARLRCLLVPLSNGFLEPTISRALARVQDIDLDDVDRLKRLASLGLRTAQACGLGRLPAQMPFPEDI